MINQYLEKIGLNEKEIKIYITLAEIGVQPASIVAKKCDYDRVTTYKNLKKMVDNGFIKIYYRNNIQCFGIESFENLKIIAKEKAKKFDSLIDKFPLADKVLKSLQGEESHIPKLEIFEGEIGIKKFFKDLMYEVKNEDLKQVRMITSNTFEEKLGDVPLSKFVNEFYSEIKRRRIDLEIFEASGTLIPERLKKVGLKDFTPEKLPAARGTTNIFIAGHAVYIACYQKTQIGLKIKQSEISQIFHFLFDFVDKNVG